jgi:hypothetical protein
MSAWGRCRSLIYLVLLGALMVSCSQPQQSATVVRTPALGVPGGAPVGVLLIEAGRDWRRWLSRQGQECVRAGAQPRCLKFSYRGDNPYRAGNTNCKADVIPPAAAEKRGGQTYVRSGTTIEVDISCEHGSTQGESSGHGK